MQNPAPAAWSPSAELVAEVDAKLRDWRQGDYVTDNVLIHVGDSSRPLTPIARDAGGAAGEVVLTREVAGLVVITQSCDLVRTCKDQPYVQVAQLVNLSEGDAAAARGRRRPRYAHIPGAGPTSFADLDATMDIEKSVLSEWDHHAGCETEEQRRDFSEAVRRKFGRFAFPDDVAKVLDPLRLELDKHDGKQTALGAAVAELREIRLLGSPDWSAPQFDLYVYFLLPASDTPLTRSLEEWRALVREWLEACHADGQVRTIDGEAHHLDKVTAQEYVESDEWDTDTFSEH